MSTEGKCFRCDAMTNRAGSRKDGELAYLCSECGLKGLGEFAASWLDTPRYGGVKPPCYHDYRDLLLEFIASFWEGVCVVMSCDLDEFCAEDREGLNGTEEPRP